jgi:hypothetical protein
VLDASQNYWSKFEWYFNFSFDVLPNLLFFEAR